MNYVICYNFADGVIRHSFPEDGTPQIIGPQEAQSYSKKLVGFEDSSNNSYSFRDWVPKERFKVKDDTEYELWLTPVYADTRVEFSFNANGGSIGNNNFTTDNEDIINRVNTDGSTTEYIDICSVSGNYTIPSANQFGLYRDGYKFLSWESEGYSFNAGKTISISEYWPEASGIEEGSYSVQLTAVWSDLQQEPEEIYNYTLHLNIHNYCSDESEDINIDLDITTDDGTRLPPIAEYIPSGHTFKGWATSDLEPTWYQDQDYVDNITPYLDENGNYEFSLSAIWGMNPFTITFDGNGSDSGYMEPQIWDTCQNSLTLNKFEKNNAEFIGWNTQADGGGIWYEDVEPRIHSDSDFTLYAQWKDRGHYVTFNINSGEIFTELPEDVLNAAISITSTAITLELWPNESSYCDVSFLTPIKQVADNTIFFGWYDSNGVRVYSSDGYAISGDYWYDDGGGNFTWNDNGDVDLYSRFEIPQEYVITFDCGEGLEGPAEQTYIAEYQDQLTFDTPHRYGYLFLYWTDVNGNILYPGDILSDDYTSDFTLYACWDRKYYNISFNANGGTNTAGGMFDQDNIESLYPDFHLNVSYQEDISYVTTVHDYGMFNDMSSNIPTRDYYEFLGWYTYNQWNELGTKVYDKEGHYVSGNYWTEDGFWKYEGEVVLFALWNPLSFKVTFNANGGINEDSSIYDENGGSYGDGKTNTHGYAFYGESLLGYVGTPTRNGYEFLGWYDSEDQQAYNEYGQKVEGKYWSNGYWIYTEDVTLYAKWLEIEETYENNIFVKDEDNIYHGKIYALTNSGYVIGKIYVNINGEWKLGL